MEVLIVVAAVAFYFFVWRPAIERDRARAKHIAQAVEGIEFESSAEAVPAEVRPQIATAEASMPAPIASEPAGRVRATWARSKPGLWLLFKFWLCCTLFKLALFAVWLATDAEHLPSAAAQNVFTVAGLAFASVVLQRQIAEHFKARHEARRRAGLGPPYVRMAVTGTLIVFGALLTLGVVDLPAHHRTAEVASNPPLLDDRAVGLSQ